mmetsp:Transcript_4376/g.7518  ORF Transcript_4376/g.7518 Transcript_4376/m.7518 type:complete len:346 (-) Transcript_4376:187-1224(-)
MDDQMVPTGVVAGIPPSNASMLQPSLAQNVSAYALPRQDESGVEIWDEARMQYGIRGLLRIREAMQRQQLLSGTSPDMQPIKFLIPPGLPSRRAEQEPSGKTPLRKGYSRAASRQTDDAKRVSGDGPGAMSAKFVPDLGSTQVSSGGAKGQWWQVLPEVQVIIRDSLDLNSPVVCEVRPGHYVQQAGAIEVFVSGQISGLQRMPVLIGLKTGWVTVDATTLGGQRYLQMVARPRWTIVYKSDEERGDVVVRRHASLESDAVAVLMRGTEVEQTGPQQIVSGIVRMPIVFPLAANIAHTGDRHGVDRGGSVGWVTCDASSVGGPEFFRSIGDESIPGPSGLHVTRQ